MSDDRKPRAFSVDDPAPAAEEKAARTEPRPPQSFEDGIVITPEAEDPFLAEDLPPLPVAEPRRRRFSFGKLALGAFGILLSLALGLWADRLVRDLFARYEALGYVALAALVIGLIGLAVVVIREITGIMRLSAVQSLKEEAEKAMTERRAEPARAVIARLDSLLSARADTARARARLKETDEDIIDGPHLVELAERELMSPLDRQARALILNASKRVSIVTAVSPRAIVDLAYVLFEVVRLVRAMADLYGGRPGSLGMIRLTRDVIAHLAVTGSIAVGDGLAQQVLGHGLASKLSTRLGEGVINGLMTARIGIAAMDLCRPLPFKALRRPGIGDFIGDITPRMSGGKARD
ncbi:TIGR01620 family protein [Rhizobiaceae bacterium BDR2-2]|uniref:UPF0283 membrane protein NOF55_11240 n=1 Tax=Ectorhizobium quercum TaxID=2965071 RepID=A0AAE3N0H0_9HYPH|nr:TIGR01620 family protein [Ectorhizobium quercum]MCX8997677.1 TIGR01620 family protein [Ectorhizobium quercum]